MIITDAHIDAFSSYSYGRSSNDELNNLREEFIAVVLNADSADMATIRKTLANREQFDQITKALENSLDDLENVRPELSGFVLESVARRGGRRYNYDFEFDLRDGPSSVGLKVELKRGESIFDQPQFLSLYATSSGITSSVVPNYAEYFFDTWFDHLRLISGCSPVSREFYLSHVCGTSYDESPFDVLYEFAKANPNNRRALSELQHLSIHDYLAWLQNVPDSVDVVSLQARLYEQLEKVFLSWDPHTGSFAWQRFLVNELTLSGSVSTKTRPNGQISTLVLDTQTGQELQMLLRWKNNPCVKGPAWQVKLTST